MDTNFIDQIRSYGDHEFLTCMKGVDGRCYYIASLRMRTDYGDKFGRVFIAYQPETNGGDSRVMIEVGISKSVAATSSFKQKWSDPDKFFFEYGLHWMRNILSKPLTGEFREKKLLTSYSADSEFDVVEYDPRRDQQKLREDILLAIAKLEAATGKRVQKEQLLAKLCTDPKWIDPQLRVLEELKLLEGIVQNDMQLTGPGHLKLEELDKLKAPGPANVPPTRSAETFDVFVSYASEDGALVRLLVAALEEAGIRVWHDVGRITLGDSITDKINVGLSGSRFGLFVLSEKFLAKKWTMTELRTLFTRQTNNGQKTLLPLLYGIDAEYIQKKFPLLSDFRAELVTEDNVGTIVGLVVELIRKSTT